MKGMLCVFTVSWKQLDWEAGGERSCVQMVRVLPASQEAAWVSCNPRAWKPGLSSSHRGKVKDCWLEGDTVAKFVLCDLSLVWD